MSASAFTRNIISGLKRKGLRIAVASAADLIKVRTNLACIGVDESLFNALVTGSDVERKKPDPEIFLKAAKEMGIEPKRCMVIEDAKSGIAAAKAAGMTCIAITSAFSRDELAKTEADFIIEDINDAPAIIYDWLG